MVTGSVPMMRTFASHFFRFHASSPRGTLVTPADTFVRPNGFELFGLGRLEGATRPYFGGVATANGQAADRLSRDSAAGIVGPYGYIIE